MDQMLPRRPSKVSVRPKHSIFLAVAMLLLAAGFAFYIYRGLGAYEEAMAMTPPPLDARFDTPRLATLRAELESGLWAIAGEGDSGIEEIFSRLRLPDGIDGYIEFFRFKRVRFSPWSAERNKRNAEFALARVGLVPVSDDGVFHVSADRRFGAVFLNDSTVSLHRRVGKRTFDGSMIRKVNGKE